MVAVIRCELNYSDCRRGPIIYTWSGNMFPLSPCCAERSRQSVIGNTRRMVVYKATCRSGTNSLSTQNSEATPPYRGNMTPIINSRAFAASALTYKPWHITDANDSISLFAPHCILENFDTFRNHFVDFFSWIDTCDFIISVSNLLSVNFLCKCIFM